MDIPRARRIEAPTWINTRTVLGLLLFLLSFLGAQRILAAPDPGVAMWVAAERIVPGQTISREDLVLETIDLPTTQLQRYAVGDTDLVGASPSIVLEEGELIPLSSVALKIDPALTHRVTIPIDPTHAVGGQLRPGDHVDVYGTFEAAGEVRKTVLVARDILVHRLVTAGGLVGEEGSVGVTVAVSSTEAERIVSAIRRAEIDLVLNAAGER